MNTLACPSPYSLTRVAAGAASPEERAYVTEHARGCAACQAELEALRRQGPAEAYETRLGDAAPLPEPLWNAVAEALRQPPVRLRLTVAARALADADERAAAPASGLTSENWLELLSGAAELIPLTAGATRSAGTTGAAAVPLAGRLVAGAQEALVRRGPNRLTVVMTAQGQPAPGRRVRLVEAAATPPGSARGAETERIELTDASGVAVFPGLPAGDYLLELEGMEP